MVSDFDVERFLVGRTPRTRAAYARDIHVFRDYLADLGIEVEDVQRYHLIAFRDHLEVSGASPATVNRRLSVARQFANATGADVPGGVRSDRRTAQQPTVSLDDVAAMIGEVGHPSLMVEGVATLWSAARLVGVERLLQIDAADLSDELALRLDGEVVRQPRSMRSTLRALVEQAGEGPLFGGITRQAVTRRVRELGEMAGLDGVTPRVLMRSSDRVCAEASTAMDRPLPATPDERIALVADAVRKRLRER